MSKLIDITNQTFGSWKVLERAENRAGGRSYWKCLCQACGNIKEVAGSHLRSGRSTNCGCVRMEKMRQALIKDETGKIYGHLKVLRQASQEEKCRQDRVGIYWVCECLNCGNQHFVTLGDYLRNGDTTSCGCINSKNESKIAQMLNSLNIKYQQQYPYRDLYFDFAIFSETNELLYIIEYDGIQHFEEGHFHSNYKITHQNDLIKNKYCFDNNIPLIRIPYNKTYEINDIILSTTKFLLTQNNEQQYYNKQEN